MSTVRHWDRSLVVAIGVNLIAQAGLLFALALAGEWRVWRFLADFTAELDAVILLAWMVRRSWQQPGPGRSA